jgi:hypothetical protein
VSQFLIGKSISAMAHLPYSPDLASAHFWLFPKLKSVMKGKCFLNTEGIKSCEKNFDIPIQDFKSCFWTMAKAGIIAKNWREITLKIGC